MEGQPGSSSSPAPTRPTTRSQHVMESGSSPSTAPADAAAVAQVQNASDAERQLDLLLQGVEEMAPLLSQAALRAAVARLQGLVHGIHLQEAAAGDSPLQPEHLSFTFVGGCCSICELEKGGDAAGDERAVDGDDGDSVGSLDRGAEQSGSGGACANR